MVNDILAAIHKIPTEEIEKAVVDGHKLGDGYYFILRDDDSLDGPYFTSKKDDTMPHDILEWFRIRDFFTQWLNNDANKALSGNVKNWLSATPLMLCFKKNKVDDIRGKESFICRSATELDAICHGFPEAAGLVDGGDPGYSGMVERLTKSMFVALDMLENQGIEVKDTVKIRIFLDSPVDEYVRSGKKYLYGSLFNRGTASVTDGKTTGPSTFFINMNSKKKYVAPREMHYKAPFILSLEDAYRMYMFYRYLCRRQEFGKVYIPYDVTDLEQVGNNENTEGYVLIFNKGNIADFSANVQPDRTHDYYISNYVFLGPNEKLETMKISAAIKKYILRLPTKNDCEGITGDEYFVPKDSRVENIMPIFDYGIDEYVRTGIMPETVKQYLKNQIIQTSGMPGAKYAVNAWLNIKYNGRSIDMRDVLNFNNDKDYCYAAGQLAYYMTSQSDSTRTRMLLGGQWMRVTSEKLLKIKLQMILSKYEDKCYIFKEVRQLKAKILGYVPKKFYWTDFAEGYFADNILYNINNENKAADAAAENGEGGNENGKAE